MSIVDDVLDFLAFLLVLGVCIAVAFSVVLPSTREQEQTVLVDKSAPSAEGYASGFTTSDEMNKLEVMLMTQVQDGGMPAPSRFKILDAPENAVNQDYKAYTANVFYEHRERMSADTSSFYIVDYDYGATEATSDDVYTIKGY